MAIKLTPFLPELQGSPVSAPRGLPQQVATCRCSIYCCGQVPRLMVPQVLNHHSLKQHSRADLMLPHYLSIEGLRPECRAGRSRPRHFLLPAKALARRLLCF